MRFFNSRKRVVVASLAAVVALLGGGAAFAFFSSTGTGTGSASVGSASAVSITQDAVGTPVYDSIVAPTPPDTWSMSYGGTNLTQLGNAISLGSSPVALNNVVVALDSQACETGSGASCSTTPGATFPLPVTLNIYAAPATPGGAVGAPLASDTQTFNIPFRPSASPAQCAAGTYNWSGYPNDGSQWYNAADGKCYYGTSYMAVFNFQPQHVTIPSSVVYGIAYDATSGPGSSLNVMLSNEATAISVGSDTNAGNLYAAVGSGANDVGPGEITCSTATSGFNSYSTTAGANCGLQSPNQDGTVTDIPQVEFNAGSSVSLFPGGPAQPINFTITNPGSTSTYVHTVTIAIAQNSNGNVESAPGVPSSAVSGCLASWFTVNNATDTVNRTIAAGQSLDWVGTASISMPPDNVDNQNACEGATIGLTFTAS